MKRKVRSLVSVVLVILLISRTGLGENYTCMVVKGQVESAQQYVVMAKNDTSYQKIEKRYGDSLLDNGDAKEVLQNEKILVANLTEKEAKQLEVSTDTRYVEKNICFSGNSESENEEFIDVMRLKEERKNSKVSISPEKQWNLDIVEANELQYKEGKQQVTIAILDSGVSMNDEVVVDKRINLVPGEEHVEPMYEDVSGHGTSIASVIAAKDNGKGITGINPDAIIYSVKVLDDNNLATLDRVVEGIYWCIENHVNIINMSFGTQYSSDILEKAVKDAKEAGILMIAAAGNRGEEKGGNIVDYPAAYQEVMAVGSVDYTGKVSATSSYGKALELVAPGEGIPVEDFYEDLVITSGTSMATPHVTGVASVLWSRDLTKSSDFIRGLLNASAKKSGDELKYGNGIVDLKYALLKYGEYAERYEENNSDEIIEINQSQIQKYSEQQVHASWFVKDHKVPVDTSGILTSAQKHVIMIGAKIPDEVSYLCYRADKTDAFHGHTNFVGNYIYVMRMAKVCYGSGMGKAVKVNYPGGGDGTLVKKGKSEIDKGIAELRNHWRSVLSGQSINNHNKAYVLVGIATHIAMDAYAHMAAVKGKHIVEPYQDKVENKTNGVVHYGKERYTCAKNCAQDILYIWKNKKNPSGKEFYQSAHNKDHFQLKKFLNYVGYSDTGLTSLKGQWFKERTYG